MSNMAKENKKTEEFYKKALDEFMSQYMGEDVPENERIISYEVSGYGSTSITEKDGDIGKATLNFIVEPYSKENTIWTNKKEWINNGAYTCYLKFIKEGDDYVVQDISLLPEYYEEFMIEYEKYKENKEQEKNATTEVVQAETSENYLANQEIKKIGNGIFITSAIILVITVNVIMKMIKNR